MTRTDLIDFTSALRCTYCGAAAEQRCFKWDGKATRTHKARMATFEFKEDVERMAALEAEGGELRTCSLCGTEFRGIGNNPEPLRPFGERCCDACNATRVVPERIARLQRGAPPRPTWAGL